MIQLEEVSKRYGSQEALHNLTIRFPEGETSILLGPSGCGKSTTLRLINRLITPDSGRISLRGKDIREYKPEILRRGMGYVIQSIGLLPHFTVEQNISIVPGLLKWESGKKHRRTMELLEMVGLEPDQYSSKMPGQLSGGEAQRIGVARALAADPPILLMDEPFGAVDPLNREQLQKEFIALQRRLKKTVVFVTHDIEEAVRIGDRIAIMKDGELQQFAPAPEIMMRPANDFVGEFIGQDRALKLLSYYNATCIMDESASEDRDFRDSIFVLPETSLKDCLSRMLDEGVSVIPVREGGTVYKGSVSLKSIEDIFLKKRSGRI